MRHRSLNGHGINSFSVQNAIAYDIGACTIPIIRDGMIQGTGVSMHHAKNIMTPQYITAF